MTQAAHHCVEGLLSRVPIRPRPTMCLQQLSQYSKLFGIESICQVLIPLSTLRSEFSRQKGVSSRAWMLELGILRWSSSTISLRSCERILKGSYQRNCTLTATTDKKCLELRQLSLVTQLQIAQSARGLLSWGSTKDWDADHRSCTQLFQYIRAFAYGSLRSYPLDLQD
jgi:hypothetical protein